MFRSSPYVRSACFLACLLTAGPLLSGEGRLVLDESSYCRAYFQFGFDRMDAKVLKEEGEKILGDRNYRRLERDVKQLLAYRKLDWAKEDWRDHAVLRHVTISHHAETDPERLRLTATPPPPAAWAATDFEDGSWLRFRKPFGVGATGGMHFAQWSMACPGFQAGFYRFRFELPDPAKAGELTLACDYVGGLRVFLNGTEIARQHLSQGELGADSLAEGYGPDAYRQLFSELPKEQQEKIIQKHFKDKEPPKFYGFSTWRAPRGSHAYQARNRILSPLVLPPQHLKKGANVLAFEVRVAPLHPMILYENGWSYSERSTAWLLGSLSRLELRAASEAVPLGTARPAGVQVWAEDMHRRVYSPEFLEPGAGTGTIRIVGAQNGRYGAQLVVGTDVELTGVQIVPEALSGPDGANLAATNIRVQGMAGRSVTAFKELGGGRQPTGESFYTGDGSCFPEMVARERWMPDLTEEKARAEAWQQVLYFDHITDLLPEKIPAGQCRPYWLTFSIPEGAAPGTYQGVVKVSAAGKAFQVPVEVEVMGWRLPEPGRLQAIAAVEHCPYAVAKRYNVELWSAEHFEKLAASLKQLARIGNDWWFVPSILNTEFGNKEDTLVRWTRKKDGSFAFDYARLDRFLDLIATHCGEPRVVTFVVMHGAPGPVEVLVQDEASGKEERLSLGGANHDPALRQKAWRAFATALYAHMRARGLGEAMNWGYAWDTEGDPALKPLLRAAVPDVFWSYGAHSPHGGSGGSMYASSLAYFRARTEIFSLAPGLKSACGWRLPEPRLLNPRVLSACQVTEGHSPPFNYRLLLDRALVSGYNGIGRIGGDYWGCYYDGCSVSSYHQAGFSILQLLWPGPEGAESGQRFEALREGIQEAEARIFLEQALERKLLPEETARRVQEALDAHHLQTLYIPVHVAANLFTENAMGWRERSRRLLAAASEAGALVGIDTDLSEIGVVRTEKQKDEENVAGEIVLPALGRKRLKLALRNWTGKPRAWKASASVPWIQLGKTEGTLSGHERLDVVLSGEALAAGATASGKIAITGAEGGSRREVAVNVHIGKTLEVLGQETIYNLSAGGSEAKTFAVLNHMDEECDWALAASQPWLQAAPASGKLPPRSSAEIVLTANPPGNELGIQTLELSLSGAGGKAKDILPLSVFVFPAYAAPKGVPAGQKVPLHEAHKELLVSHRSWSRFRHEIDKSAAFGKTWSFWHSDKPVAIGTKSFEMGLWVLPYHETVYKLEGKGYRAFSAEVGINAIVAKQAAGHESLRLCFEVHVDGKIAAHSGLMKSTDEPRLLAVEGLEGAKELKLVTRMHDMLYGDGSYRGQFAYSNWADPALYK